MGFGELGEFGASEGVNWSLGLVTLVSSSSSSFSSSEGSGSYGGERGSLWILRWWLCLGVSEADDVGESSGDRKRCFVGRVIFGFL